ncbi:hypothetical protein [Clostridium sp. Marseille-QA1073]
MRSSVAKVVEVISMDNAINNGTYVSQTVEVVSSMKDIQGFV